MEAQNEMLHVEKEKGEVEKGGLIYSRLGLKCVKRSGEINSEPATPTALDTTTSQNKEKKAKMEKFA